MDLADISFSFEATRWIVTAAIGIYAWLIGRQSASAQELLELRTRITTLEAEMKQVPSQTQLTELVGKLERMVSRVDAVADSIQPIARSLDRINDYLLKHK